MDINIDCRKSFKNGVSDVRFGFIHQLDVPPILQMLEH